MALFRVLKLMSLVGVLGLVGAGCTTTTPIEATGAQDFEGEVAAWIDFQPGRQGDPITIAVEIIPTMDRVARGDLVVQGQVFELDVGEDGRLFLAETEEIRSLLTRVDPEGATAFLEGATLLFDAELLEGDSVIFEVEDLTIGEVS